MDRRCHHQRGRLRLCRAPLHSVRGRRASAGIRCDGVVSVNRGMKVKGGLREDKPHPAEQQNTGHHLDAPGKPVAPSAPHRRRREHSIPEVELTVSVLDETAPVLDEVSDQDPPFEFKSASCVVRDEVGSPVDTPLLQ